MAMLWILRDIKFFSKCRTERLEAIAHYLQKHEYDVVCLQELRHREDYGMLKDRLKVNLPNSYYFFSGVIGSGICVFTKHEIQQVLFHPWSSHGYLHQIHHGDWFSGKGIGLCKIKFEKYVVNVYSAHFNAEYESAEPRASYKAHRIVGAHAAAHFVALTSEAADVAVVAGDLSCRPGDLLHRMILYIPNLRDSFVEAQVPENMVHTYQSPNNTFTSSGNEGSRIDYILYKTKPEMTIALNHYVLPLAQFIPGEDFSYSNHCAVEASISIGRSMDIRCECGYLLAKKTALTEGIRACDVTLENIEFSQMIHMIVYLIALIYFLFISFTELECDYPSTMEFLNWVMTIVLIYCAFVVLICNPIEKSTVIAGRSAMLLDVENTKKQAELQVKKIQTADKMQ